MGGIGCDCFEMGSNSAVGERNFIIKDICQKRKYEEAQYAHPIQEHKFQVLPRGRELKRKIHATENEGESNRHPSFLADGKDHIKDDNSLMITYEATLPVNAEDTLYKSTGQERHCSGGRAASSNDTLDHSRNDLKHNLCSVDSRKAGNKDGRSQKESGSTTMEDDNQCKSRCTLEDFEMYYAAYAPDFLCSEYGFDEKQLSELVTEDLLRSKDVEANMSNLPPLDQTLIMQDTKVTIRKPTIDQEFEQYFSSLLQSEISESVSEKYVESSGTGEKVWLNQRQNYW